MALKKIAAVTAAAAVMLSAALVSAGALNKDYELEFELEEKAYTVNGTAQELNTAIDAQPVYDFEEDCLYLPLRLVVESIGGKIAWDSDTEKIDVTYQGLQIELKAGETHARINGYGIELKSPPKNINHNLYVSSEFISNNLGSDVEWDGQSKKIKIKTEQAQRPVINVNVLDYKNSGVEYHVDVPVVVGLNDKNYEKALNEQLLKKASVEIASFMKQVKENQYPEGVVWQEKMTVATKTDTLISFVWNGVKTIGDQTVSSVSAININLQSQKVIQLNDIFKNKNYMDIILEETGMESVEENHFYISEGNLVLFSRAMDTQNQEENYLSWNLLKKYLKDEYNFLWIS